MNRQCSKSGCSQLAVMTLTFSYRDSSAVLGPLATQATPGCYDLCAHHSDQLTVPQGWEIIRLSEPEPLIPDPDEDDLLALAEQVRAIGLGDDYRHDLVKESDDVVEISRRGHLRMIADADRL